MLPALIHPADVRTLITRVRSSGGGILARLLLRDDERVLDSWQHLSNVPRHWSSIPAVRERVRTIITGDPRIGIPEHVAERCGPPPEPWRALSLGCGTGQKELAWGATRFISSLDAFDLSPVRIAEAQRLAGVAGLRDRVRFAVGDARTLELPPGTFDLIFVEDALHHLSPLRRILERVSEWLAPGGLFVINEYVGPPRFQWTARQLAIANELLQSSPAKFRTLPDGSVKRPPHRPGTLSMFLSDPSEAAESDAILPLIRQNFSVIEEKPYGGAVLHLLFKDIAHHFQQPDAEAREFLQRAFSAEDSAMARGEIQSDFVFCIAQKRAP